MQCRLVLIRHGESVLGSEGRYAGHIDTPLTSRGRRQVLRLRNRFESLQVDRIYSSDLERCRATADLLAPGRQIILSRSLRELDFGRWEGTTHRHLLRTHRSLYEKWLAGSSLVAPPGGETLAHLAARVRAFARRIALRHPSQTAALVTHGGPFRVLLAGARGFWSVKVPPASMELVEWPHGTEAAS